MSMINKAYGDTVEAMLRYIGASSIKKIGGILYFIEFNLNNNLKISYTYNINSQNKYCLQRVEPYPIPEGVFEKEYEVVSFIEEDIKKFSNAQRSNNFDLFLEVTNRLNNTFIDMEKLFLNYNIDKVDLQQLKRQLDEIYNLFQEAKEHSPHIDLDKE